MTPSSIWSSIRCCLNCRICTRASYLRVKELEAAVSRLRSDIGQLQQQQHHLQQHQLHQLQQLLQLVPQQLFQLQQLVQLLPQQLQQIQQLVQFLPQQIQQLQQQLVAHQTPFGAGTPGFTISQPFGAPFAWSGAAQGLSPITALQPFGIPSATGHVM